MSISIIIIVKNDRGIANTLAALRLQIKPAPTEIIVVDASDPFVLQDIRMEYPEVRWYQFVPSRTKTTSIPEQRNFGIQHATGGIIVFIDANCVPVENWLCYLCQPILDGREKIVSGVVRTINPRSLNNLSDEKQINGEYLPECATINLAFARDITQKTGLLDEQFLYGSDVDFTWRAVDAGFRIKLARLAAVSHDWGSFSDEIRRSFKYGLARARLYRKHPRRLKNIFGYDIRVLVYPLYLVFLPLTILTPWYLSLLLIPMYRSRHNKPIKFTFLSLIYGIGILRGVLDLRS